MADILLYSLSPLLYRSTQAYDQNHLDTQLLFPPLLTTVPKPEMYSLVSNQMGRKCTSNLTNLPQESYGGLYKSQGASRKSCIKKPEEEGLKRMSFLYRRLISPRRRGYLDYSSTALTSRLLHGWAPTPTRL